MPKASCLALVVTILSHIAPFESAIADDVNGQGTLDTDPDRLLSEPHRYAFVAYPLELLTYATINAPQISFELWFDLEYGLALNLQPRAIWYPPAGDRKTHDWAAGGAIGVYWFTSRSLTGPFYGIYGGDVEAPLSTGHGRIFGATATFGYAIGFADGGILSFSFGLGYWHRQGSLNTGVQWPEILSLRIGTGYGWGVGRYRSNP